MASTKTITTEMGQAAHMGKWESACQMVRLIRELQDRLDEAGMLGGNDTVAIDGIVHTFLAEAPKKVADEVREG